jgi:hypothetical protein
MMSKIIQLNDYREIKSFNVSCKYCKHEFVASEPCGFENIACPACDENLNYYVALKRQSNLKVLTKKAKDAER